MSLVWDLDLPASEKLVLLAYADHADQAGKNIYPAVGTIAEKTSLARRTVQRATRSLEEKGLLIADGSGKNGVNKWRFGGDTVTPRQNSRGDTVTRGGRHSDTGGVTLTTKRGDTVTPEPSRTVKETSNKEEEGKTISIFSLYEQEIGPLTPMIAQSLEDDEKEHGANWVSEAIKIASARGARNYSYISAILKRWKVDGYGSQKINGHNKSNKKTREQIIAEVANG